MVTMRILQNEAQIQAWVITWLLLGTFQAAAGFSISWGGEAKLSPSGRDDRFGVNSNPSAAQLLQAGSRLPSAYEVALNELQQLESEPLCHRTAATLLVNNCQLLEGKDEATILTDSGRQIRDFVDAYAASLAICDLQRGNIAIPRECAKFREGAISQLALANVAHLHVTSREINGCLSGLGSSDSAWNTWISYRHKALRFCEAARVDNEKAQNIHLFQRLTKIMRNLADGVDQRIAKRMSDLETMTQMTSDRLDTLSPQLDRLKDGINLADDMITGHLMEALKRSNDAINAGTENAVNLQNMLELMLRGVLAANAEAASAHEEALSLVSRKAESEISAVVSVMAAAVASVSNLQDQIELSRLQVAEVEHRQEYLEQGMQRLVDIAEDLSTRYDDHSQLLQRAQNATIEILGTLDDTVVSAAMVGDAISKQTSVTSWWPYIWCPAASLVLGSYGLPPSALRNLGLVALGEAVGFAISSFPHSSFDIFSFSFPTIYGFAASEMSSQVLNTTHDHVS